MHHVPARPPPRGFNPAPHSEAGAPLTSSPGSDRGALRQNTPTNVARGVRGRHQPQHLRPVNARPAAPPQPGAQPVSSSPLIYGTAPLVVRGNGHRPQGMGQTSILTRQTASSSATRVSVPLITRGSPGIEARATVSGVFVTSAATQSPKRFRFTIYMYYYVVLCGRLY